MDNETAILMPPEGVLPARSSPQILMLLKHDTRPHTHTHTHTHTHKHTHLARIGIFRWWVQIFLCHQLISQRPVQTSLEKQLDPRAQIASRGGLYQYL